MELAAVEPVSEPIPAFAGGNLLADLRAAFTAAFDAWLIRTPSPDTRRAYQSDTDQFLAFVGIEAGALEQLATIRPEQASRWRDQLNSAGLAASSIRRKLTTLRSLFSYLQIYGFTGANPAHGKFVKAPPVARDGKTVGLSPADCRRLLDAPGGETPAGIRDRAMLAILAYSGCRV